MISPAPSCLREVLRLECRVRCVPFAARLMGDDPVPVVIAEVPLPVPLPVRAETALEPFAAAALTGAAAVLFTAASPHTLQ